MRLLVAVAIFLGVTACATSNKAVAVDAAVVDSSAADASVSTDAADASTEAANATDSSANDAALVLDPSTVDAGMGGDPPALTDNVTLHVAGDSTAAIFPSTDPRVGWAAVLQPFFGTGITVNDVAKSGRSSKSYYDEGLWSALKAQIHPGDYVFIEFGHNDEKVADPTRYTDPETSYRWYLKTFIAGAREMGGYPILMTSICRRQFNGTTVTGTHGAYTVAVFAVGTETGTPVIDMESKTKAWLEALGVVDSVPMFAPSDNTHLSATGAPEVAKLAVDGMRELSLPIVARLSPSAADGG